MGGIKIGIGFSVSRAGIPSVEQICRFAERVEDLGIDSIWPSDHIVSRQPSLDVACVMALFAARTKRVKMGPSVLSLPARDPVLVAKTYATLDHLTGGRRRVIMAVGLGADPRDTLACGIKSDERGARMREGVDVLRKLWSGPNVTHSGRFYRFENVTIEPRPVGGPLDVWIGGNSEIALKRVARYGDGWNTWFSSTKNSSRPCSTRVRLSGIFIMICAFSPPILRCASWSAALASSASTRRCSGRSASSRATRRSWRSRARSTSAPISSRSPARS